MLIHYSVLKRHGASALYSGPHRAHCKVLGGGKVSESKSLYITSANLFCIYAPLKRHRVFSSKEQKLLSLWHKTEEKRVSEITENNLVLRCRKLSPQHMNGIKSMTRRLKITVAYQWENERVKSIRINTKRMVKFFYQQKSVVWFDKELVSSQVSLPIIIKNIFCISVCLINNCFMVNSFAYIIY